MWNTHRIINNINTSQFSPPSYTMLKNIKKTIASDKLVICNPQTSFYKSRHSSSSLPSYKKTHHYTRSFSPLHLPLPHTHHEMSEPTGFDIHLHTLSVLLLLRMEEREKKRLLFVYFPHHHHGEVHKPPSHQVQLFHSTCSS